MRWRLLNRPLASLASEKGFKIYFASLTNGRQHQSTQDSDNNAASSGEATASSHSRFSRRKDRQAKRVFLPEIDENRKPKSITDAESDCLDSSTDFATSNWYPSPVVDEKSFRGSHKAHPAHSKKRPTAEVSRSASFCSPLSSDSAQEDSFTPSMPCNFSTRSAGNKTPESAISYLLSLRRAYAMNHVFSTSRRSVSKSFKLFLFGELSQSLPSGFSTKSASFRPQTKDFGSRRGGGAVKDIFSAGTLPRIHSRPSSLYWTVELAEEILLSYAAFEVRILYRDLANQAAFFLLRAYGKASGKEGEGGACRNSPLTSAQDIIRRTKVAMAVNQMLEFGSTDTLFARQMAESEHLFEGESYSQPRQKGISGNILKPSPSAENVKLDKNIEKSAASRNLTAMDSLSNEKPPTCEDVDMGKGLIRSWEQLLRRNSKRYYWIEMLYTRELLPTLFNSLKKLCEVRMDSGKSEAKDRDKGREGIESSNKPTRLMSLENQPFSRQELEAFSCLLNLFNKVLVGHLLQTISMSEYEKGKDTAHEQEKSPLLSFTEGNQSFIRFRGPFQKLCERNSFEEMVNWRAKETLDGFKLPPPSDLEPLSLRLLLCGLHRFTLGVDSVIRGVLDEAASRTDEKGETQNVEEGEDSRISHSSSPFPFIAPKNPGICTKWGISTERLPKFLSQIPVHGVQVELTAPVLQFFFHGSSFSLLTSSEAPFYGQAPAADTALSFLQPPFARAGALPHSFQESVVDLAHKNFLKREEAVRDLILLLDFTVQFSSVSTSYQVASIAGLYARAFTWCFPQFETYNSAHVIAPLIDASAPNTEGKISNTKISSRPSSTAATILLPAEEQMEILRGVQGFLFDCMDELLLPSSEKGKPLAIQSAKEFSNGESPNSRWGPSLSPLYVMHILLDRVLRFRFWFSATDISAFLQAFSKINFVLHNGLSSSHPIQDQKSVLLNNPNPIVSDSSSDREADSKDTSGKVESWFLRMKPAPRAELEALLDVLSTIFFSLLEKHVHLELSKPQNYFYLDLSDDSSLLLNELSDDINSPEEPSQMACKVSEEKITVAEKEPMMTLEDRHYDNNANFFHLKETETATGYSQERKANISRSSSIIVSIPYYLLKALQKKKSGFFFSTFTPPEFLLAVEMLESLSLRPNIFENVKKVCGLYLRTKLIASDTRNIREITAIWMKFIACSSRSLFALHSPHHSQNAKVEGATLTNFTSSNAFTISSEQEKMGALNHNQRNSVFGSSTAELQNGGMGDSYDNRHHENGIYDDPQLVMPLINSWRSWISLTYCRSTNADGSNGLKEITISDIDDLCWQLRFFLNGKETPSVGECSQRRENTALSFAQLPADTVVLLGWWPKGLSAGLSPAFIVENNTSENNDTKKIPPGPLMDSSTGSGKQSKVLSEPFQFNMVCVLLADIIHQIALAGRGQTSSTGFIPKASSCLDPRYSLRLLYTILQSTFPSEVLSGVASKPSKMDNESSAGKLTVERREKVKNVLIPLYVILRWITGRSGAPNLLESSFSSPESSITSSDEREERNAESKNSNLNPKMRENLNEEKPFSVSIDEVADAKIQRPYLQVWAFQKLADTIEECLCTILNAHSTEFISSPNHNEEITEKPPLTSSNPSHHGFTRRDGAGARAALTPYEIIKVAIILHDAEESELSEGKAPDALSKRTEGGVESQSLLNIRIIRKVLEEMLSKSLVQAPLRYLVGLLSDLSYVFADTKDGLVLPRWVLERILHEIRRQLPNALTFAAPFGMETLPRFYAWTLLPFLHFSMNSSGGGATEFGGSSKNEEEKRYPLKSINKGESKSGSIVSNEVAFNRFHQASSTATEGERNNISLTLSTDDVKAAYSSFVYQSIKDCQTLSMLSFRLRQLYLSFSRGSFHLAPSLSSPFAGGECSVDDYFPLLRDLAPSRAMELLRSEDVVISPSSDLIEFLQVILQTELKITLRQGLFVAARGIRRGENVRCSQGTCANDSFSSLVAILHRLSSLSPRQTSFRQQWVSLSSLTTVLRSLWLLFSSSSSPAAASGDFLRLQKKLITSFSPILLYACELQTRIPCHAELVRLVELLMRTAPEWILPVLTSSFAKPARGKSDHSISSTFSKIRGGKLSRSSSGFSSLQDANESSLPRVAAGMLCMLIMMKQMKTMPHLQPHDDLANPFRVKRTSFVSLNPAKNPDSDRNDPARARKEANPEEYEDNLEDLDNLSEGLAQAIPHRDPLFLRQNMLRTIRQVQHQTIKVLRECEGYCRKRLRLSRNANFKTVKNKDNSDERKDEEREEKEQWVVLISMLTRSLELEFIVRTPVLCTLIRSLLKFTLEAEMGWSDLCLCEVSVAPTFAGIHTQPSHLSTASLNSRQGHLTGAEPSMSSTSVKSNALEKSTFEKIVIALDDDTAEPFQVSIPRLQYRPWREESMKTGRFQKKMKTLTHENGNNPLRELQDCSFSEPTSGRISGRLNMQEESKPVLRLPSTLRFISLEAWINLIWQGASIFFKYNHDYILKSESLKEYIKTRIERRRKKDELEIEALEQPFSAVEDGKAGPRMHTENSRPEPFPSHGKHTEKDEIHLIILDIKTLLKKHAGLGILVRLSPLQVRDLFEALGPLSFLSLTAELIRLYTGFTTANERFFFESVAEAMPRYKDEGKALGKASFDSAKKEGVRTTEAHMSGIVNIAGSPFEAAETILSSKTSGRQPHDENEIAVMQKSFKKMPLEDILDAIFPPEVAVRAGINTPLTLLSAAWLRPWLWISRDILFNLASSNCTNIETALHVEREALRAQKSKVNELGDPLGFFSVENNYPMRFSENNTGLEWEENKDRHSDVSVDETEVLNSKQRSSGTSSLGIQSTLPLSSQALKFDLGVVASFLELLETLQPHLEEQRLCSSLCILREMNSKADIPAKDHPPRLPESFCEEGNGGRKDDMALLGYVSYLKFENTPPNNSVELLVSILNQLRAVYVRQVSSARIGKEGMNTEKHATRGLNTGEFIEVTNISAVLDFFRGVDRVEKRLDLTSTTSTPLKDPFVIAEARKSIISTIDPKSSLLIRNEFGVMDLISTRIRDQLRRIDEKRLQEAVLELLFALPIDLKEDGLPKASTKGVEKGIKAHHIILRRRLSHIHPHDLSRLFSILMLNVQHSSPEAVRFPQGLSDTRVLSEKINLGAQAQPKEEVCQAKDNPDNGKGYWNLEEKTFDCILLLCEVLMDLLPSISGGDVVDIMEEVLPVWRHLEEEGKDEKPHVGEENKSVLRYELRRFLSTIPTLPPSSLHRFSLSQIFYIFTRLHTPREGKIGNGEEEGKNEENFFEISFVSATAARAMKIALTPDSCVEEQEMFAERLRSLLTRKKWNKLRREWMRLLAEPIESSRWADSMDYKENLTGEEAEGQMRLIRRLTDILAFIEVTAE